MGSFAPERDRGGEGRGGEGGGRKGEEGGLFEPVVAFAMSPLAAARFAKRGRRQLSELAPIDLRETPEMGEAVEHCDCGDARFLPGIQQCAASRVSRNSASSFAGGRPKASTHSSEACVPWRPPRGIAP